MPSKIIPGEMILEDSIPDKQIINFSSEGTENIFIGEGTTHGDLHETNVFIGFHAGYNNDDSTPIPEAMGERNVYIGRRAGEGATVGVDNSGSENVGVGARALQNNTIGYENTAIGDNALVYNTTGHGNTALGNDAIKGVSGIPVTGNFNVGIGCDALYVLNSGQYNSAVGYQGLYSNTTGDYNIAIGYQALYSNIVTNYNVAIGYQALKNAVETTRNLVLGHQAGFNVEKGAVGDEGSYNLYMGYKAGYGGSGSANLGWKNVALGAFALYYNTSGHENVAIGETACDRNTEGYKNIAIGKNALYYNITGDWNTAIGVDAGKGVATYSHNYNTFIGSSSGFAIRTGASNTCIGRSSGNLLTTGSSNIFIGKNAGSKQTTLSNRFIVDNQSRADVATELSNAILYGIMAATPADQSLRINATIQLSNGATIGISTGDADLKLSPSGNLGIALPSGVEPTQRLSIGSGAGTEQLSFFHTGWHAAFQTTKGSYLFTTAEGTNTNSYLVVKGKGTGKGYLYAYDEDDAEAIEIRCSLGHGYIQTIGSSPGSIHLQDGAHSDVRCFANCIEGETQALRVYGYKAGDAQRHLAITTGGSANDTVDFTGLNNYKFNGAISAGTLTVTTSSDNLDVSGVNVVFINITSNIVLGGLTGGVDGQVVQFVYKGNYTNTCKVEDTEGIGDQDFYTHTKADETIDGGGYTFVCDGSNWYDCSHARHV